jgi:hypothetical protein
VGDEEENCTLIIILSPFCFDEGAEIATLVETKSGRFPPERKNIKQFLSDGFNQVVGP